MPAAYLDSDFLFLANIDPVLQSSVRRQLPMCAWSSRTINYRITGHRENLGKMLTGLDALLINDGEAKLLAGDTNLVRAARKILAMGPKALVSNTANLAPLPSSAMPSRDRSGSMTCLSAPRRCHWMT